VEFRISAPIPAGCRGDFFNLVDDRDLLVSSPMTMLPWRGARFLVFLVETAAQPVISP
jgi:hypothetical protein